MSEPIIIVEALGKKYSLHHMGGAKQNVTLRDVIVEKARGLMGGKGQGKAETSADSEEEFWALRDVSFDIRPGEVVGIIGRNGAGKSTLLKVLSRITEPTQGRVRLRGRVASLLEVGTGFHPELTGRENVFLNGAVLGMSRAEIRRKFDEIVAFAEVEKFLDTPVKHYSSGMYVRLAFAVAAHLEPEILIVDEVLAVGDAAFQQKCIGKMESVAKSGRTILFVSHQIPAVRTLTKRCIFMEKGKVRADGPTSETLETFVSSMTGTAGGNPADLRPRWATPFVQKIVVKNSNGLETTQIRMGGGVRFEVSIASDSRVLKQPVLGVIISSMTHGAVAGINTRMKPPAQTWGEMQRGMLSAEFDSLPLTAGRYVVDIWIGDGAVDVDAIERAIMLDVVADDVYGSGVVPFTWHGPLLLDPKWGAEAMS